MSWFYVSASDLVENLAVRLGPEIGNERGPRLGSSPAHASFLWRQRTIVESTVLETPSC